MRCLVKNNSNIRLAYKDVETGEDKLAPPDGFFVVEDSEEYIENYIVKGLVTVHEGNRGETVEKTDDALQVKWEE